MKIVLDESVAARLGPVLEESGHEVIPISSVASKGMSDTEVWYLAVKSQAILVTRDHHFANPLLYDPSEVGAVIYLRAGNIKGEDEVSLVRDFLSSHSLDEFRRRLVSLSPNEIHVW
ncbi:MAG: DUF5615 family PIN-like protein [Planctomycetota bacterium]